MTYISGLTDLLEPKKEFPDMQIVLHSDQDSVYASKNFKELSSIYKLYVARRYPDRQCYNGIKQRLDQG